MGNKGPFDQGPNSIQDTGKKKLAVWQSSYTTNHSYTVYTALCDEQVILYSQMRQVINYCEGLKTNMAPNYNLVWSIYVQRDQTKL